MKTTFGSRTLTKPEGMLRAFTITNLVRLDEETGDGRLLKSEGAGSRELPRTVFGGFAEGDGHGDNVPIGRLDAIEFDPENNTATGWGWLLDDANGRQAALYASTGTMRHNSIHMAEVEAELIWKSDDPTSPDFFDYTIVFHKFNVASTTMLGIPAFANSAFSLDDELTASIFSNDEPLELGGTSTVAFDVHFPEIEQRELMASLSEAPRPPWEHFFRPEPEAPHGIVVDERGEDGWVPVYGHLAQWNICHDGIDGRCVIAPRPPDDFDNFNASHVLTDEGLVGTGPLFLLRGHPDGPLGDRDAHKAYGGAENAWADVRVSQGIHGPWVCGVVRPNVTDDSLYVARASRVSGHWAGDGRLKAIVSVNVPGYDNPGRGSRVYTDADGNVMELVASFVGGCSPDPEPARAGTAVPSTESETPVVVSTLPPAFTLVQSGNTSVPGTTSYTFEVIQQRTMAVPTPQDPAVVSAALALLELEAQADADSAS